MFVNLNNDNYEIKFELIQIEITGVCNMCCNHCRASIEKRSHLSTDLIKKAINFAVKEGSDDLRLTFSGGEPFLHPKLFQLMKYAEKKKIKNLAITTNGSIIDIGLLKKIKHLNIPNFFIQISIDSINPQTHDSFRNHKNAFSKAIKFMEVLKQENIVFSIKSTLIPKTINEMESLIIFSHKMGAKRISFGSVIPSGRGLNENKLWLNSIQKKDFIKLITNYKKRYLKKIEIVTEDPLKSCIEESIWGYSKKELANPYFYGGCTAGISMINVNSNGEITPCSLLPIKIVNIRNKSLKDIRETYIKSKIIKKLLKREFTGACNNCVFKNGCGGCRAIPYNLNGDLMGDDSTCWKKIC